MSYDEQIRRWLEDYDRSADHERMAAALRAVLDVCAQAGVHKQTSTARIEQVVADALGVG